MICKEFINDLLFPPRCAICDDILPIRTTIGSRWRSSTQRTSGSQRRPAIRRASDPHRRSVARPCICPACKGKPELINEPFCLKCGKELAKNEEYCDDCKSRKHLFERGMSVFVYGSVSDSLYRFKNKGRQEYADFYAQSILKAHGRWLMSLRPDALVPVPVHRSKRQHRGYNQAELIANNIFRMTGIPVYKDLIIREKRTGPLKDLSLKARQNNIKGAFKVTENAVKLKTIVIIDDIYTTGTTIDEMCRCIKSAFDCKIYFLTVAIGRG